MLAARSLVCAYPGTPADVAPAAGPLDFAIAPGEWLVIVGGNGSGKTALLLTLAGLVPPRSGWIERPEHRGRPAVGVVFQEPETQFVTDRVARELAFPLENLGRPRAEIDARVAELLGAFGLSELADAPPARLSGGEMQRVALAAAIAPRPSCLLLDEPAAYLDRDARAALAAEVARLRTDDAVAVVWTACERAECPEAERVIELDGPAIDTDAATDTGAATSSGADSPRARASRPKSGETIWRARDLALELEGRGSKVRLWGGISFEIRAGEIWLVTGPNGAGKTSLLDTLVGWRRPSSGMLETLPTLDRSQSLGYLCQDPESQLFAATALEDVAFGVRARTGARGRAAGAAVAKAALARAGLDPARFSARAPESLSLGERRRLALAGVLAGQPAVLLLDEPSVGLDPEAREALVRTMKAQARAGDTIVIASHDPAWLGLAGCRRLDLEPGQVATRASDRPGFRSS